MSATTRKKKAEKAAVQARRRDTLNLLTGDGDTNASLVQEARDLVNAAWIPLLDTDSPTVPGIVADHDEPYVQSRDGSRKRLRATWEHLRAVLPDYNERKSWGRRTRAMHALIILAERQKRGLVRQKGGTWSRHLLPYNFNEMTPGVAEALRAASDVTLPGYDGTRSPTSSSARG
jgi:hypothetical protein